MSTFNVQKSKEEFETIVKENINRAGISDLMEYLETSDFYISPASTRYHGSYAGGLVEHSLNVYYSLIDELTFLYGPGWESRWSKESVAIVSLFHDVCKIGRYTPGTRNVKDPVTGQWHEERTYYYNNDYVANGHGAKSVFIINKYIKLSDDEISAIYWHMGAYDLGTYNTVSDLSNCYSNNTLAFALHRADMVATHIVENEKFEPLSTDN